jgi:mannuronan synthase
LALVLFAYSPRVDLNYIWCLYANQLVNAGVKLYTMWRLPQQKWANRGNQQAGMGVSGLLQFARRSVAAYLTLLSIISLVLVASIWTNLLPTPRWGLTFLLERWVG